MIIRKHVQQAAMIIRDNPAIMMHTQIYLLQNDNVTCMVCSARYGDVYSLHTPDRLYKWRLCLGCVTRYRNLAGSIITADVMMKRTKLLVPLFNINYVERYSVCILCCTSLGVYKNAELAFICKPCKEMGSVLICSDVMLLLQEMEPLLVDDVRREILILTYDVMLGYRYRR